MNTGTPAAQRRHRRVALATLIGATVEWYDFFIYALAAGLVFPQLFFAAAGDDIAVLVSFASAGLSFLFRPLGAMLSGHFGDLLGRRLVLVVTLVMMGISTTLIGLLPTYAAIGVAAPVLLLLLRILQGLSAGGEWAGAALLAVEHAPPGRRGAFGAFPQAGVPLGLVLASAVLALTNGVIAPGPAFLEWGWRIPFLLSVLLLVIGVVVRLRVAESPVFVELARRKRTARVPMLQVLWRYPGLVLIAALTFAGNNASGYMTTGGFVQRFASDPRGLAMDGTAVQLAVGLSGLVWLASTWGAGALSDRIGRRSTYLLGWAAMLATTFPMLWLLNTGNPWLLGVGLAVFTVGLGLTYGPQSALFAELFPASIRFSGASTAYALGSILGGAFAPLLAQALVGAFGSVYAVGWYLVGMVVLALVATLLVRDRSGIPLGTDHECQQSSGTTYLRGGKHRPGTWPVGECDRPDCCGAIPRTRRP